MNNPNQINALYELYKHKAEEMSLDYMNRIKLMNVFISEFVKFEEYETAEFFKREKIGMYKRFRKSKRLLSPYLFYRVWRLRLYKFKKMIKAI
jgi:hypothetical protein